MFFLLNQNHFSVDSFQSSKSGINNKSCNFPAWLLKATEAGIDESNDLLAALPKDLSRHPMVVPSSRWRRWCASLKLVGDASLAGITCFMICCVWLTWWHPIDGHSRFASTFSPDNNLMKGVSCMWCQQCSKFVNPQGRMEYQHLHMGLVSFPVRWILEIQNHQRPKRMRDKDFLKEWDG